MPARALFMIYDTEPILARVEALVRALAADLETLFVVRLPRTAARLQAQGYPALLACDVLNWEHLFPYRRSAREVSGRWRIGRTYSGVDISAALAFDLALAHREGDRRAMGALRIQVAEIARRFLSLARFWQPELIFVWNGWTLPYSPLKQLARAHGAIYLCAERGLVPDALTVDSEGVNAGSYLCGPKWDEIAAKPLDGPSRALVEEFRQDYAAARESVVATARPQSTSELRQALQIPQGACVLLCPAQLDVDTNPVLFAPDFPTNLSVVDAIMQAIGDGRFFLLFKTHPEDQMPQMNYQEIIDNRGRVVGKDVALHDVMDVTDIVVARNSTVGFEGLLLGKPVVALGRSLYSDKGFTWDVTAVPALRSALEEAAERGLSPEQNQAFQRFLWYLLTRYHFYTSARTGWQEEANARKLKYIREALKGRPAQWGAPSASEEAFWQETLSLADHADGVGQRIALRAAETGLATPRQILVVKAASQGVLERALARVQNKLPEASVSVAVRRPSDASPRIDEHARRAYVASIPADAAALLARTWDTVIYSVTNVSHPPKHLYWVNRLIRGRTRLLLDDLARMLTLPGSGRFRFEGCSPE